MSNATLSRADHGHGSRGEKQQMWLATQAKICGGCNEDGEVVKVGEKEEPARR